MKSCETTWVVPATRWSREHTLEQMAEDYRRVMAEAVTRPVPVVSGLPSHFTDDYSSLARKLSEQMGVDLNFPSG